MVRCVTLCYLFVKLLRSRWVIRLEVFTALINLKFVMFWHFLMKDLVTEDSLLEKIGLISENPEISYIGQKFVILNPYNPAISQPHQVFRFALAQAMLSALNALLSPFSSSFKNQIRCLLLHEIVLFLPLHSIRYIPLLSTYFNLLYIVIVCMI